MTRLRDNLRGPSTSSMLHEEESDATWPSYGHRDSLKR